MIKNSLAVGLIAATLVFHGGDAFSKTGQKISRADIERMFEQARKGAKWKIDEVCLWGYFFIDPARRKLELAGRLLTAKGYRLVGVWKGRGADDGVFTLHAEKVERHSVHTLMKRNEELYKFARAQGLETYDGMDVGPLPGGKCQPEKH